MCKGRDMDWAVSGPDSPDTASDSCDVFFVGFALAFRKARIETSLQVQKQLRALSGKIFGEEYYIFDCGPPAC